MTPLVVIGPMSNETHRFMYHVHVQACPTRAAREYRSQEDQDAWNDPQEFVSVQDVVSVAFQEDVAETGASWADFEHLVLVHDCIEGLPHTDDEVPPAPVPVRVPVPVVAAPPNPDVTFHVKIGRMAAETVSFPEGHSEVRKGRGVQFWHDLTWRQYTKLLDDLRAVQRRMTVMPSRSIDQWKTLEAVRRSIVILAALKGDPSE